jgi:hypothetical protein
MSRRGAGFGARAEAPAGGSTPTTGRTGPTDPAGPSPAALRSSASRWRDPRLLVGLVVVAVCTLLGARLLAGADDTVAVWAARDALGRGQQVTADLVVRRQVRFQDQADADRYLSANTVLAAGAVVSRPVGAGELLPRAALGRSHDSPTTQVPLSVPADALPATVRAGSSVDVWVTPQRPAGAGPASARSRLLFDDVTVVAVPDENGSLGPATTRQVIVGVPTGTTRLAASIAALSAGDVLLTVER